jgi:integrase/recombinase XerC
VRSDDRVGSLLTEAHTMPKPYKVFSTRPLPPNAEIIDHDGKPHVRVKVRGKVVLCPLTKDGTKCLRPSARWYFDIPDANGKPKRTKGFADLKATEQLSNDMARKAERVRSGFTDPAEEHIRRPLADHLKDYTVYLSGKGSVAAHVQTTRARIAALFSACEFRFFTDIDTVRAGEWLNSLRRDAAPAALPEGDTFTPAETAKLLGISRTAVRATAKRMSLSGTGNGKARRLPRTTVEALVMNRAKGCGPETVNHYIRAVRGFFRWLVRAKRIDSNPLDTLSLVNAAVDVRRTRRELTEVELGRLFVAARASTRTYRGLAGADRYFLYLVAAGTGFRASALSNLTPADFDLDTPTVTLSARFNKSRKLKVQPLPVEVANTLRDYLAGKPASAPVWGGTWAKDRKGAEMIRIDLDAAGIPYATEGPDGPEYADFHALRHSFLTLGGRSGIDLRTLQELAGHSTPLLTARYSHRRLYDLAGAVNKLPNLIPTNADAPEIPLRMTGTEPGAGVVPGVVTGDIRGHQSASSCNLRVVGANRVDLPQPLEMKGPALLSTGPHQSASERAMGFEPTTSSLEG